MRPNRIMAFILIPLCFCCCTKNEVVNPVEQPGTPFTIDAVDYSKNYYFVDTSFVALFTPLFTGDSTAHATVTPITDVHVWVLRWGSNPQPNELQSVALINLFTYSHPYPDSLRYSYVDIPGAREFGRFAPLTPDQYSLPLGGKAGLIALRVPVSDSQVIAVSFRKGISTCGETEPPDTSSPLLLQMVKPKNLLSVGSAFPIAWRLILKSVYSTGTQNIDRHNLRVTISCGQGSVTALYGRSLLNLLGLDHLDHAGNEVPQGDGLFDFVPGITIDRDFGELILPDLRPFDDGLFLALRSGGATVAHSDQILIPAIYDTVPHALDLYRRVYTISGRAVGF